MDEEDIIRRDHMIEVTPQAVDDMMDWLSGISDAEGPGTTRLLYSLRT